MIELHTAYFAGYKMITLKNRTVGTSVGVLIFNDNITSDLSRDKFKQI